MTPESRNSGGRARRPLLDNGPVIMFSQQGKRMKKQSIAYRVTSIPRRRFRSHGNESPKHSNSEERGNSTAEGGDLHTIRREPTSGRDLTNRRQDDKQKSEVKALFYV
jgi:hypothetical protein